MYKKTTLRVKFPVKFCPVLYIMPQYILITLTKNIIIKEYMKKIITTLAFIALTSVSAKAIGLPSMPDLGNFQATLGLSANSSVFGASAKSTGQNGAGADRRSNKESGVFTDSYQSQFIELGFGQWVSIGYEHSPDAISTPEAVSNEGNGNDTVQVDFNDLETTYVKLNLPVLTGAYIKAGTVSTDVDIKETMGSGSVYKNVSIDGEIVAIGYSNYIRESNFALRFETAYMSFDNAKTDNGIASGTVNNASGSVNHNRVEASNIEGLQAKVAITYTFGKN